MLPLPRHSGCDVIASLPFAVRRLFVDEEDAVAVIDERGAVGEEQRLEPGFVVGGGAGYGVRHIIAARDEARPRVRRVGDVIGGIIHVVKVVGPAGFEPASGGL